MTNKIFSNPEPTALSILQVEVGYTEALAVHNLSEDKDPAGIACWIKTNAAAKAPTDLQKKAHVAGSTSFRMTGLATGVLYNYEASFIDAFADGGDGSLLDEQYLGTPTVLSNIVSGNLTTLVPATITSVSIATEMTKSGGTAAVRFGVSNYTGADSITIEVEDTTTPGVWVSVYSGAPLDIIDTQVPEGIYASRISSTKKFSDGSSNTSTPQVYGGADFEVEDKELFNQLTARYLNISADSIAFFYTAAGDIRGGSQTITFKSQYANLAGNISWSSTTGQTGTADTFTLTDVDFGANTDATITAVDTGDGSVTDSIIVRRLQDGSGADGIDGEPAIVALLSNDVFTVPTDKDGNNGIFTGSETTIRVFEGTTELTYTTGPVGAGQWSCVATNTNMTNATLTNVGPHASANAATSLTADTGSRIFTITVNPSSEAVAFDIVKTQNFSKNKQGATGNPGINSKLLTVSSSSPAFAFYPNGNSIAPSSVTITAKTQNLGGSLSWVADPVIGTDNLDGTYTITAAEYAANTSVLVTATQDGLQDSVSILRVQDGLDGENPIVLSLGNENHTLPADNAGVVTDFAGSGTTLNVYEGVSALQYDGIGTADGTWKITSATPVAVAPGALSDGGPSAVYADITALSADVGTITFTVQGTDSNGTAFSGYSIVQSFSKAYQGIQGDPGYNSATVYLYKRGATSPAKPTNSTTYTFATKSLTAPDNSWERTIGEVGATGDPIWVIAATATSQTATDAIANTEWSTPVKLAENGIAGLNSAMVSLYQRKATTPAVPSTTETYTFATSSLTTPNNGWYTDLGSVPNTADPLYVTTAQAVSNTATDDILTGEWATPAIVLLNQQGLNLASSELWETGTNTAGNAADGVFAVTGQSNENVRYWGDDPFGRPTMLWRAKSLAGGGQNDGGWVKSVNNLKADRAYMSVVYFRRVSTDARGSYYHGCGNVVKSDATETSNPYFTVTPVSNLTIGRWYVSVGYIYASTATLDGSNVTTTGGVYDLETSERITVGANYKMRAAATTEVHRTFLFYGNEDSGGNPLAPAMTVEVDICSPAFYEINGNEPSLNVLIGKAGLGGTGWFPTIADATANGRSLVHGDIAIDAGSPKKYDIQTDTWNIIGSFIEGTLIVEDAISAREINVDQALVNTLMAEEITATGSVSYNNGDYLTKLGGPLNLFEAKNNKGTVISIAKTGEFEFNGEGVLEGTIPRGALSGDEIDRIRTQIGTVSPVTGGTVGGGAYAGNNATVVKKTESFKHGTNDIVLGIHGGMYRSQAGQLGAASATVIVEEWSHDTDGDDSVVGTWVDIHNANISVSESYDSESGEYYVNWRFDLDTTRNPTTNYYVKYRLTIASTTNWTGFGSLFLNAEEEAAGGQSNYVLPTADGTTKGGVALDTNYFYLSGEKLTPLSPTTGSWWRGIPRIQSGGVMEIGKYIDFHDTDTTTADNDFRITSDAGTLQLSGKLNAPTLGSTVATGTAPFTVNSTTKVTNLNADLLDDLNSSQFIRSDANDTTTGTLTIHKGATNALSLKRDLATEYLGTTYIDENSKHRWKLYMANDTGADFHIQALKADGTIFSCLTIDNNTGDITLPHDLTANKDVSVKGELNYKGVSDFYIDNQVYGSETFLRGRTSTGEIHTTLLSVMGGAGSSDLQLNHNNTRVAQTETGGMIFGEDIGNTGYVRIRQVAGNGYVHASQGHLWLYSDGAGKNVQVQIRNTDSSYDTTFQVLPGASAGTSYVRLNYGDTQKLITTATGTTTNGVSYVTGDVDVDADINVKGELNYTGTDHFYIENEAENKHIYIRTTHSGGKDTHIGMVSQADPYLDLKRNNITVARTMPGGLRIGGNLASDFLDVVHDGFNGYMYNYKGHMYLYNISDGSNLYLTVSNDDGSTDNVVGVVAGTVNGTSSVELYYGDSRKLYTGTSGTYLDDDLIVNGGHHINASGGIYLEGELNYDGVGTFVIDNHTNDQDILMRTSQAGSRVVGLRMVGNTADPYVELYRGNLARFTTLTDGIRVGTSPYSKNVTVTHDNTNGWVKNSSGDLYVKNNALGENLYLGVVNDTGDPDYPFNIIAGATDNTSYVILKNGYTEKLRTTSSGIDVTGSLDVDVDINVKGQLNYDGIGEFYIDNEANEKNIFLRVRNNAGTTQTVLQALASGANSYAELRYSGAAVARTVTDGMRFGKTVYTNYVAAVHNDTNGYFSNTKGALYIRNYADGSPIYFTVDPVDGIGSDTPLRVVAGATEGTSYVAAHYGGTEKLRTTSSGIDVTGSLDVDGAINTEGDLSYDGIGTAFFIDNTVTDSDIILKGRAGGVSHTALNAYFSEGQASGVELRHNNAAAATTIANGMKFGSLMYGTPAKYLSTRHDGSHSYIDNVGAGNLHIRNTVHGADVYIGVETNDGFTDYPIVAIAGATTNTSFAALRYGDSPKLVTDSTGVAVTGTVDADIGEFGSSGTTTTSLSVITNKIAFDSTPSASEASAFIQTGTAQVLFGQDAAGYPTIQGAGTGTAYHLSLNPTAGTVLVGDRIGFNNDTGKYLNRAGDFLQWTNQTGFVKLGVSQDNYTYINSDSLNGFYFDNGAIFRDQGGTAELRIEAPTLDTHEARLFLKSGTSNMHLFWRNSDKNFGAYIEGSTRLSYVHSTDNWHFSNNVSVQGLMTADIVRETSDERVKSDFAPITEALTKTRTLAGETYLQEGSDERLAGVRAQLVEKVLPEAIGYTDDETLGKKLSVKVSALPALLVEAVKELADKNDALEARVEKLERMMEKLTNGLS